MDNLDRQEAFVWHPTPEYVERSHLQRFMDRHDIGTLEELMARATDDVAWFWEAVLDQLDVRFYEPYDRVVDLSQGLPWAEWCVGGVMNVVHNCLDKWMGTPTQNRAALRWEGEEGDTRVLTYGDLYREVNRLANGLRALGLGKGDAIGLYMPMVPEIAVALLAIAKIGGIILPLFSGYGATAVATRLADADAKALFTVDGFYRRGEVVPIKPVADEALTRVPSVEHVIVYPRLGRSSFDKLRMNSDKLRMNSDKLRMNSDELGMNSDELGMNSDELRMNSDELRMNSDELGMNSDELGMNSDELGMNSDELGMNSDELGMNSDELGMNSDELGMNSDELGMNSDELRMSPDELGMEWTEGRDRRWEDVVAGRPYAAETERTAAEDVLMIIYTSGTTGRPKGAVHTHCGFPIKAAQDMAHGLDMHDSDTLYWVTDMGWMMGPWEVFGTLLLGGTMLFYDGAPDYPGPDRMWSLIERHGVTIFGVSPTLVRALMRHGEEPVRAHDLSSLRVTGSTGSPWNPAPWRWFFYTVGQGRLPIINYSGGTEISGGIVMGNVLTPLKPCAFSGPVVGMAADVLDADGQPVRGEVGELVVRQPWIGMTRGFWKDPERYIATYWSRFPDTWVHGDWAMVDADGLWYILGRSDDTIKVGGKRLGPAEVESALVEHPAVAAAAAVGVPDPVKGQEVVCFCVLQPNQTPDEALARALQTAVAEALGKPLKPREVRFVSDLPKTRNAKVMRRVIRAAYLGEDPGDLSALVNPQVVDEIARLARA